MWFRDNLARLHKERDAIASLAAEVDWLLLADWELYKEKTLCLVADIEAHGYRYEVAMFYPTNYPANPPTVIPRKANQHWSTHQYGGGGELCLEWGPDNWHEELTSDYILRSVQKLLFTENPKKKGLPQIVAPSRHSLTLGQQLESTLWRFVVNDNLISYTQSLPQNACGMAQFWIMCHRKAVTAFAKRLVLVNGNIWNNTILPKELENTTSQIECRFFKTNLGVSALNFSSLNSIISTLKAQDINVSRRISKPTSLVLFNTKGKLYLFSVSDPEKWVKFTNVDISNKKDNSRLPTEFTKLKTKKVGIVGVGSAGSKVALSLARTGVRDFLLVDHDIFLPENICRHELNWEDVGQHKVDGITHQLKLIAQDINVKSLRSKLSGQESTVSIDSTLSQLGACDLIVDATADPVTFNQLSSVACQKQTSMVWLEIYEGGIGGMIARFRPNRDPDPKTMRAHLDAYWAENGVLQIDGITDYTAVDSEGRIIVASDSDITVIAANATKLALDILIERDPPQFPYSLYVIGLTGKGIFKAPFDTTPIDLKNTQLTITEPELSENEANENRDFIEQLVLMQKNEDSSTD